MKQSAFASEFDPSDLRGNLGSPMTNEVADAHIQAKGAAFRVQESLLNLLTNAVYSYYFAKRVCPALDKLSEGQNTALTESFCEVRDSLLKGAVIGIATTIDLTGQSREAAGRTRSLPHALDVLKRDLTTRGALQPDGDRDAALELIGDLLKRTNADVVISLKYVRHLRNKWAGHSSLDLTVDEWADANENISWPILEDALVRMVNVFQDLSELVPMSAELAQLETGKNPPEELPDGTIRIKFDIAWSGAISLSEAMRFLAQRNADAFIEALGPR